MCRILSRISTVVAGRRGVAQVCRERHSGAEKKVGDDDEDENSLFYYILLWVSVVPRASAVERYSAG